MIVSGFSDQTPSDASSDSLTLLIDSGGSTCLLYSLYQEGKRLLVKRLRPEYLHDARMREIFYKEFETGCRIRSPFLVEYIRVDEDAEGPYIVMEYVDGETMEDVLATRPQWFAEDDHLLRFFDQLLQCLETLHSHQILHLDLKPDNIMLTSVSSDVKVIDLGYCYTDTYYATTGKNPLYAAPEQQDGSGCQDIRSDLYAVGRLIDNASKQSGHSVGRRLRQVIEISTNPDPALRYDSAKAMRNALHQAFLPRVSKGTVLSAVMGLLLIVGMLLYLLAGRGHRQVKLDEYQYTLLSDDSLTCRVDQYICNWPIPNPQNRCIYSPLSVDGKDYQVVQIGDSLFFRDSIVQTVSIPEGVVRLGSVICMECKYLHTVTLPSSLQSIGYDAFAGCESLGNILLPSGLQFIGHNAFVGTRALEQLTIPSGIRILHQDCFTGSGLRSITLPDSLEFIERGVFYGCDRLQRIILPATLRSIGDFCFHGCDSLREVVALSPTPIAISNIFATADSTLRRTLYVPSSSVELYLAAPYWQDFSEIKPLFD